MTRLFGSVDTEEVRELKVNLIDQRIKEGHSSIKNAKEELIEFSTLALADIDRFQQQKVVDIRETLAGYVLLQIKMCRKEVALSVSHSSLMSFDIMKLRSVTIDFL
uniref:(California timema) hypothetical protein n=1 Tax=Timema californicum TaxID=61474 RepID=A0A7R9PDY8_TIMCA|nr:unnamed protein product [Timema californicum]